VNVRVLAVVSVLANVALVAVGLRVGRGPASDGSNAAQAHASAVTPASRVKTNVTHVEVTLTNEAAPFHWRDVQSEDLEQFAAGLRRIGCPPQTVRAIIERELWNLILARRRELVDPIHRDFWNLAASSEGLEKSMKPVEEAVRKLQVEILEKLDAVSGAAAEDKRERTRRNPQVDFLSQEKQQAMEALEKNFNEEMRKVQPTNRAGWTAELRAKSEGLKAQRKEAIRALMTAEEHAEYELRQSRHAHAGFNSVAFDATADDLRQIARIYNQFEAADAQIDNKKPNADAKKAQAAEAKRQREEALKQMMGAERYAQFQQGSDGTFKDVHRITERYGLPREAAGQAAEIINARNGAMKALREDKEMTAGSRAEREMAVALETRAALLQALGERALRTYERYHGPVVPAPKEQDSE